MPFSLPNRCFLPRLVAVLRGMPIRQLCQCWLFCLLLLPLSACSLPLGKESGLFGRFPENYEDPEDGFTLWMPANMRSRFCINRARVQQLIDACVSDRYRGAPYTWPKIDVYKQLDENTRLYAYYCYYNKDEPAKVDALPFDRDLSDIRVRYITVFNITVDKEGLIMGCKYWRFRR